MRSTLLLNVSYEPLSVVSAQRAVTLIVKGKAASENDSPYTFRTGNGDTIGVPYVARMNYDVKKSKNTKPVKYTRKGILVRDNYTCVYCGKYGNTIDHIVPRSKGGKDSFENCVACCSKCNNKKTDKFLHEIGWKLNYEPYVPRQQEYGRILAKAISDKEAIDIWLEYLSWYDESAKRIKEKRELEIATV